MYGSETISGFGPKIWNVLPTEFKKYSVSYIIQRENS